MRLQFYFSRISQKMLGNCVGHQLFASAVQVLVQIILIIDVITDLNEFRFGNILTRNENNVLLSNGIRVLRIVVFCTFLKPLL